jgi:hypothetical protein
MVPLWKMRWASSYARDRLILSIRAARCPVPCHCCFVVPQTCFAPAPAAPLILVARPRVAMLLHPSSNVCLCARRQKLIPAPPLPCRSWLQGSRGVRYDEAALVVGVRLLKSCSGEARDGTEQSRASIAFSRPCCAPNNRCWGGRRRWSARHACRRRRRG